MNAMNYADKADERLKRIAVAVLIRAFRSCAGLLLVASMLLSLSAAAADRALLIGINDYSHGGFSPLSGTLNDVKSMTELLQQGFEVAPENIKTLVDKQATRQAILKSMDDWLIAGSGRDDRVFFYYSGHGYYQPDLDGDESGPDQDGRDEVLVAADAQCSDNLSECKNFILDDEIGARLDQLDGRSVFVMIDSCHSGTATRSLGLGQGTATRKLRKASGATRAIGTVSELPDTAMERKAHAREQGFVEASNQVVALFAVSAYQEAPEDHSPDLPNGANTVGFFTDRVVRGLLKQQADASGDGEVSFAELLGYARDEGKNFCAKNPNNGACNRGVTPTFDVKPEWQGKSVLSFGKRPPIETDSVATTQEAESIRLDTVENILAHGNSAGLEVSIANGNTLREGDNLRLNIKADRPGLLVVYDVDVNGQLSKLYPSENGIALAAGIDGKPAGWVRPGYEIVMPDAYSGALWPVSPPYGKGKLVILLVEDGEQVEQQIAATRAFEVVERPVQVLGELRESLDALIPVDEITNRLSDWSVTTVDYEIVR